MSRWSGALRFLSPLSSHRGVHRRTRPILAPVPCDVSLPPETFPVYRCPYQLAAEGTPACSTFPSTFYSRTTRPLSSPTWPSGYATSIPGRLPIWLTSLFIASRQIGCVLRMSTGLPMVRPSRRPRRYYEALRAAFSVSSPSLFCPAREFFSHSRVADPTRQKVCPFSSALFPCAVLEPPPQPSVRFLSFLPMTLLK